MSSPTRPSTPEALFDRVGDRTVAEIVDHFYERVLCDPMLEPYFAQAPTGHIRAMQRELFTIALGGPGTYSGLGIHDAHAELGITPLHFSRYMEHLTTTLHRMNVDADVVDALLGRLALLADDVTGSGGGEEG